MVDENLQVKLIDFGSAAIVPRNNPDFMFDKFQGTIQYASPEVLKGEKYRGKPVDVWALGILLVLVSVLTG
jgi:serine/threonine protein kinase